MSTAPPSRVLLPSGLPRGLIVLLGLAATVVVVSGMRAASSLFGPVMLALVITIAIHPLRRALDRRVPSWLATLTCLLVTYGVVLGLCLVLIVAAARFAGLLPQYEEQFSARVDDITTTLHNLGVPTDQAHLLTSGLDLSALSDIVGAALAGVLSVVSSLAFILTMVLFMAVDGGPFPAVLAAAADARPGLVSALVEFAHDTRRYLVVSTVFGLIVAVFDTIALAILDVPLPALWGLLAFLTNYIPNIGFVIGLIPPAILALLDGGPGLMLAVIAIYCVLNVVIQTIIQPRVVGNSVGLSTTLTFLSLVFWAWIIGPLGAILAIPLSLLVRAILVDADPGSRWLKPLVANRSTE